MMPTKEQIKQAQETLRQWGPDVSTFDFDPPMPIVKACQIMNDAYEAILSDHLAALSLLPPAPEKQGPLGSFDNPLTEIPEPAPEPTERYPDPEPRIYESRRSTTVACVCVEHTADVRGLCPGRYRHTCPACGESYSFEIFPQGPQL